MLYAPKEIFKKSHISIYSAFYVKLVYKDICVFFWLSVINTLRQNWKNAQLPEFIIVIHWGMEGTVAENSLKRDVHIYLDILLHCLKLLQQK